MTSCVRLPNRRVTARPFQPPPGSHVSLPKTGWSIVVGGEVGCSDGTGDLARLALFDRHALERVPAGHFVHHVLPLADLAEDGVLAIEPVGGDVRDEELAAVRVRPGVGHAERADLVLA